MNALLYIQLADDKKLNFSCTLLLCDINVRGGTIQSFLVIFSCITMMFSACLTSGMSWKENWCLETDFTGKTNAYSYVRTIIWPLKVKAPFPDFSCSRNSRKSSVAHSIRCKNNVSNKGLMKWNLIAFTFLLGEKASCTMGTLDGCITCFPANTLNN